MARRLLWASLGLAPFTILVNFAFHPGDAPMFVLAAISLIPLAWLIGEATEHAAKKTGPGIGGFLNATFGNAPELIIALFAVNDGLNEVVRGSLTGSVVGNLLLVLGVSLTVGPTREIDRRSGLISVGLVFGATCLFSIIAITDWVGGTSRHTLQQLSIPVSVALLLVYVGVTGWQLHRHRLLHSGADIDTAAWPLRRTLLVLTLATAVTAVVAEILVGSIQVFAEEVHVSDFFVAAVIVAIVGNSAEHGGAVIVARRGQVKLATEIAVSSGAQVAVFLIPMVAVISWAINPLSFAFRQVEIGTMAGASILAAAMLWRGRSNSWRGWVLVAGYVVAAGIYYKAGGR